MRRVLHQRTSRLWASTKAVKSLLKLPIVPSTLPTPLPTPSQPTKIPVAPTATHSSEHSHSTRRPARGLHGAACSPLEPAVSRHARVSPAPSAPVPLAIWPTHR